ncbi:M56 family metallopeptidase [Paenimyroides aestuarii]|uniref:M56 family metallopeptidase n=1 Tax=Paenimyroides aestuarii TaxID=2968490 RepID=A0ABY5NTV2_9FLAO|nr:M56 family metallopeptidase [Paenimyroides aestuarii]UUV21868.1 M56 family metallopeptidase [Paenimyroides aestuarii]
MVLYIFKSTFLLFIFWLIYKGSLENKKSLVFIRYYLLIAVFTALLIPMFQFTFFVTENSVVKTKEFVYESISELPVEITQHSAADLSVISLIYLLVCSVFLMKFVFNLLKINQLSKKGVLVNTIYGKVITNQKVTSPFSFFNCIYVNANEWNQNKINTSILVHEQAHITQKHTVDILLIELIKVLFWFQPFVYQYKKLIQENHEYLADEATLKQTNNLKQYQELILNYYSKNESIVALSSAIHFKNLKKRFIMMKSKTKAKIWIPVFYSFIILLTYIGFVGMEAQATELKKMEDTLTNVIENAVQKPTLKETLETPNGSKQSVDQEIIILKYIKGKESSGYFHNPKDKLVYYYVISPEQQVSIYNRYGVLQENKNFTFRLEEIKAEEQTENRNNELNSATNAANQDGEQLHSFVDKKAQPKEGLRSFFDNFMTSFNTETIHSNDSLISTRLKFIVEKDGSFSNIVAVGGGNEEASNEAIRVLKTMPKWQPAEHEGKVVRSTFTMPIKIRLNQQPEEAEE